MAKVKTLDVTNPKLNKETKLPWWIKLNEDTGKKTVLINELGKDILSDHKMMWVQNGKHMDMFVYTKNGYWTETTKQKVKHMITDKLDGWGVWSARVAKDTSEYVFNSMVVKTKEQTIDHVVPTLAQFANGTYDFKTNKLKPNRSSDYFFDGRDYDLDFTGGDTKMFDDWLTESVGEAKQFIIEYLGFCFYRSYDRFQAFMIILASGNNGKSTALNVFNQMIGLNHVSNVSLQKLTDPLNRFDLDLLVNKDLNYHADISSGLIKDTSLIKSITGNDVITVEGKGTTGYSARLHAKHIFAANELPNFYDSTAGFSRRVYIVRFHRIDDFRSRFDLKKMREQIPAFTYKCIQAFRKVYMDKTQERLFETDQMVKDRDNWLSDNNPVEEFISDVMVLDPEGYAEKSKVYSYYSDFCKNHGYKALSSTKLKRELEKFKVYDDRKYIHKVQKRVYKGIKFN